MIKKIILLGKPGAGKGTISQTLQKKFPTLNHISTGDIFRKVIKEKTELGKKIIAIVKKGDYVPDSITNEVLQNAIKNIEGFLLDGYPRTINQAEFLDSICKIDKVVLLEVDDEVVIKRLSGRTICETGKHIFNAVGNKPKVEGICDFDGTKLYRRKDDMPEVIKERLKIYNKNTSPLIEYYEKQNKLIRLDSNHGKQELLIEEFMKKVLNA